jgi:GNAT superfamily N-acetyltransferase
MTRLAVEIRPLTEEDLTLVEERINHDWRRADKHRKRLDRQERREAVYVVAWHQQDPVGHALVVWNGATNGHITSSLRDCPNIEDIFVVPDLRSKGVGSQLLEHAESLAGGRGFSKIGLGVDVDDSSVRAWYERAGYRDTGFGEYTDRWKYHDRDGRQRWAEEVCIYLTKSLPSRR